MHKIRIKRQPQKGDQRDFSLVNNMIYNVGPGDANTEVKNTMTAIDRKDANVEVEGGETVVGDINGDGFLEHMSFVGKRHSKGGMPVNLPEGSFIFSDTKKLRIKDQELLSKVFGMGNRKGGYTPAEIAKKYQINEYIQVLKDENADPLKKRTAAEMLKTNTEMLSKLALVQESMKGFPDGIPALAESAAMGMQGGPEQGAPAQPEARYGGSMGKYPDGGELPKVGDTYYVNGKPVKLKKLVEDSWTDYVTPNWVSDPGGAYFEDANGKTFYLNYDEFKALRKSTSVNRTGANDNSWWNGDYNRQYNFSTNPGNTIPGITTSKKLASGVPLTLNVGDTVKTMKGTFTVLDPQQLPGNDRPEQGLVSVKNVKTGKTEYIHVGTLMSDMDKDLATVVNVGGGKKPANSNSDYGNDMVEEIQPVKTAASLGAQAGAGAPSKLTAIGDRDYTLKGRDFQYRPAKDKNGNKYWAFKEDNGNWYAVTNQTSIDRLNKHYGFDIQLPGSTTTTTPAPKSSTQPAAKTTAAPVAKPGRTTANFTSADFNFANGGSVGNLPFHIYAMAGEVTEDPVTPAAGPGDEVLVKTETKNGVTYNYYTKGDQKIIKDASSGKVVAVHDTKTNTTTDYSTGIGRRYDAQNRYLGPAAPTPGVNYKDPNYKGKYTESVSTYENLINDPKNENVRNAIYNEFLKIANQTGNKDLLNIPKDEAIKILLKGNRDNSIVQSVYEGNTDFLQNDIWDRGKSISYYDPTTGKMVSGENSVYNATMKELGLDPMNSRDRKAFQAVFQASERVARTPEYASVFESSGFDTAPVGKTDQRSTLTGEAVSPVDDIYGNTTVGQLWKLKEKPPVPPKDTPKGLNAFYCVEYTDGTKNVVTVSYNEGEQPVAPSGGNIKNVSSAFADYSSAEGNCVTVPSTGTPPPPVKKPSGPWWLQDIVNYVGATTDQVNRYGATQGSVDLQTPGYDLLDPTRQLANIQEQDARQNQQIENTVDGNVGLAATLASSGDSLGHSANILGQYENANIGIVNNAYDKNAQIMNQEIGTNEAGRVKYVEDNATLNQQIDNALNKKKWRQIAAFNNGTTNWFRKKQMEQVLFPEVYIDPIMGDVSVTPGASNREIFGPETYVNPMTGQKGSTSGGYNTQQVNAAWKQYYDEALPVRGEEEARKYATKMTETMMAKTNAAPDWRASYANAFTSGATLPGQAYGGEFQLPWEEI